MVETRVWANLTVLMLKLDHSQYEYFSTLRWRSAIMESQITKETKGFFSNETRFQFFDNTYTTHLIKMKKKYLNILFENAVL